MNLLINFTQIVFVKKLSRQNVDGINQILVVSKKNVYLISSQEQFFVVSNEICLIQQKFPQNRVFLFQPNFGWDNKKIVAD